MTASNRIEVPLYQNPSNPAHYSQDPFTWDQEPTATLLPYEPCNDCGLLECVCVVDTDFVFGPITDVEMVQLASLPAGDC